MEHGMWKDIQTWWIWDGEGCNPRTFLFIKVWRLWVFWRNEVHHRIKKGEGKERINNLYDSKVHSIILTQNPRASDGCLNDDLSSSQNVKRERCMDSICNPKTFSIALAQTQGFRMGVWIQGLSSDLMMYIEERCMDNYVVLEPIILSLHKTQVLFMDIWIRGSSLDLISAWWTINNKMLPLNLIIEFTTPTHYETLRFQELESFQLIISFIGTQINGKKQERKEKKRRKLFLDT